jgi:hypothetical protein
MIELYRSDRLLVRMHAPHRSTRLVVTFASWSHEPGLDHPGFGAAFCEKHGLDAVHVTCVGNDWYQYEDMPQAYAAIREAGRDHESLVTYGVSMGAYQAIKAAPFVGARRVLAISPQFSIDPAKAPFENRWSEAAGITFIDDEIKPARARYALVYDPRSRLDAAQAGLIARHLEQRIEKVLVQPVVMPFTGHFIPQVWKEAGIVSKATLGLLKSKKDTGRVRTLFREGRGRSALYLEGLLASGRLGVAGEAAVAARLAALRADQAA